MGEQFFISYRGNGDMGGAISGNVYRTLHEKLGYSVYCASAPDLARGGNYREREMQALESAEAIIFILTDDFFNSVDNENDEIRFELQTAFRREDLKKYAVAHSPRFSWANVDMGVLESVIGRENADKFRHIDYIKYYGQREYGDTERHLCQIIKQDKIGYGPLMEFLNTNLETRRMHSGSYLLGEITDELFPTLGNVAGTIAINDCEVQESSIVSLMLMDRTRDYIIIGDGGIGKTVLLFKTGEELLKKGIPVIYVSLHEVGNDLNGFVDKFFGENEEYKKLFINASFSVLLFDGFNEVADVNKSEVLKSISAYANKGNIQILLSSRYDPRQFDMTFNGFDVIKLEPLTRRQIENYLEKCEIEMEIDEEMQKILCYPLMLTLYTNSIAYSNTHGIHGALLWKNDPKTNGEIIWNYLQTQLRKLVFELGTNKELLECVFAIEYVLPYIGYSMYKKERFFISLDELKESIEQSISFYKCKWEKGYPKRIDDLSFIFDDDDDDLTFDRKMGRRMYKILVRKLNILNTNMDQYSFFHQNFRDCLAAIHMINCAEGMTNIDEWHSWVEIHVLRLISELIDRGLLESVLESLRNEEVTTDDFIIANVLSIYSIWLKNDFRNFNFSGLDLSNISLREYLIEGASFNNAKLSSTTFLQRGHFDSILSISNSENKDLFFTASKDGSIMIWDILDASFEGVLNGHNHAVTSLAYNEGALMSSSKDKTVRKWNLDTRESAIVYTHSCAIKKIKFYMNKMFLLDERGTLYCIQNNEEAWSTENVIAFDVNDRNGTVAVYIRDKQLFIYKYDFTESFEIQTECHYSRLIFSSYYNCLYVGGSDGSVRQVNIETRNDYEIGKQGGKIWSIIELDDKTIATASDDNDICIWEHASRAKRVLRHHYKAVLCLCYNKKRNILISGSKDNSVKLWNASEGTMIKTIEGYTNWINCVQKAKNSNILMSASGDNTVRIWDYKSSQWLYTFKEHSGWVYSCAVSASGKFGVSGAGDGCLVMMDLSNNKVVFKKGVHSNEIRHIVISHDEKLVVSGGMDGQLYFTNIANQEECGVFDFKSEIFRFAFSNDYQKVLVGCANESLYLFDVENKQIVWEIKSVIKDGVRSIAVNSDFTRGWCGGKENKIVEVDICFGEISNSIPCEIDTKTIALDPQEKKLAISGVSGVIEVCTVQGDVIYKSKPINGEIRMLDFVDENVIMSGGTDSRICFTNIKTGKVDEIRPGELLNIDGCTFYGANFAEERLREIVKENNGALKRMY